MQMKHWYNRLPVQSNFSLEMAICLLILLGLPQNSRVAQLMWVDKLNSLLNADCRAYLLQCHANMHAACTSTSSRGVYADCFFGCIALSVAATGACELNGQGAR